MCRQGFCFHHTVSAVYGELFASQDVYSPSFLSTALHICCHFITDIYLTPRACQGAVDKSHCYFVCFHTPELKEGGSQRSYFPLPAVVYFLFIPIRNSAACVFITEHILGQRESGFNELVCTQ